MRMGTGGSNSQRKSSIAMVTSVLLVNVPLVGIN